MTKPSIIKKILHSFILCAVSFSVLAQDNSVAGHNNINKYQQLYKTNKVKSIKEFRYKNEQAKGKGKLLTHRSYDTTGLLIDYLSYYSEAYHRTYVYDEKGNLYKDIGYVLNSPVEKLHTYKFDNHGRIIEKAVGTEPLYNDIYNYTYDSSGNMSRIKWLMGGRPNSFYFTDVFEYDMHHQPVKMTRLRPDNSVYFYKTYQYDANDNLVREMRFEHDDTTDVWEYRYDSRNDCVEQEYIDKLGKKHSFSQTNYNDKGLIMGRPGRKRYIKCVYEFYD
ncbi:MAG: hypothetical protein V4580_06560 [Bacteroidota bacterium]